jgi:hypothetical protein
MLQQMQIEEKAYKLLDFNFLGGSVLADIVAPYVYACWQIRWKVRNMRSTLMSAGPMAVMLWHE